MQWTQLTEQVAKARGASGRVYTLTHDRQWIVTCGWAHVGTAQTSEAAKAIAEVADAATFRGRNGGHSGGDMSEKKTEEEKRAERIRRRLLDSGLYPELLTENREAPAERPKPQAGEDET